MSLNPDTSTALITQFQGSSQASDSYDIDPAHGLYCQNCDFVLGQNESCQVQTRRGTSLVVNDSNSDGAITSIASWYFSSATFGGTQQCFVAMYSPTNGLRFYNQGGNVITAITIPVTGAAIAVFVTDGIRIYVSFTDATGKTGISQGYVFGLFQGTYLAPPTAAVDTLFASPLPTTIASVATSAPAAGVVTAGKHLIAYEFTTRNGFSGSLNPVTAGGVFAPVSFTTADGVHNLRVTITWASIPSYLNPTFAPTPPVIQIAMTTASNLAEFYLVPLAVGVVPATPGTTIIDVSISDGDLVTETNITQAQNQLTAINGIGPFNPSAMFAYSSRMGYVTIDAAANPVVYFSDQNDYQHITAAFHGVYLEGREIPVQGCSLGGVGYIATLDALYSVQDNGGFPSTWTPPSRVDGSVGILSPTCMLAVGGKMLLASEKGLYVYRGGGFPQLPTSYWQSPDWQRINWLQPTQVQVVDDSLDKVIRVQAPLKVVITGASNTNPITITTAILINNAPVAYPHLFQTGLSVTITGVGGNTNANTTAIITVTSANTFTIPVTGNGAYTSGGVATPNAPNAQMCWNYTPGDAPGQALYSLQAFSSFRASSIASVRNISNNNDEVWWGGQTNPGGLLRRVLPTDSNVYRDVDASNNPTAISSQYETSLIPGSQDEAITVHDFCGMHARVSGAGGLNITAYALDHSLALIPLASPITLSQKPGLEFLIKWALRSEQQSISFGTAGVDSFFIAAILRAYYTNSLPQR